MSTGIDALAMISRERSLFSFVYFEASFLQRRRAFEEIDVPLAVAMKSPHM
jgi:hypothetical protein